MPAYTITITPPDSDPIVTNVDTMTDVIAAIQQATGISDTVAGQPIEDWAQHNLPGPVGPLDDGTTIRITGA